MENQKNQWCNLVQVQKAGNRAECGGRDQTGMNPGVWKSENQELQGWRAEANGSPSPRRERICPFSALLFYLGPQ